MVFYGMEWTFSVASFVCTVLGLIERKCRGIRRAQSVLWTGHGRYTRESGLAVDSLFTHYRGCNMDATHCDPRVLLEVVNRCSAVVVGVVIT